jgi:hypothetical protein
MRFVFVQITYQLKILTTAMFAVTMLGKKLIPTQAGRRRVA